MTCYRRMSYPPPAGLAIHRICVFAHGNVSALSGVIRQACRSRWHGMGLARFWPVCWRSAMSELKNGQQSPLAPVRLRTGLLIRWIAAAGQLATVLIVHYGLEYPLTLALCLLTVACLAASNVIITWLSSNAHNVEKSSWESCKKIYGSLFRLKRLRR